MYVPSCVKGKIGRYVGSDPVKIHRQVGHQGSGGHKNQLCWMDV